MPMSLSWVTVRRGVSATISRRQQLQLARNISTRTYPQPSPSHAHHHHFYRTRRRLVAKHPADKSKTATSTATTRLQEHHRSPFVRFCNPWVDLANVTKEDSLLSFKIESVTRTFGVVAGLMCSLSAASLAVTPSARYTDENQQQQQPPHLPNPDQAITSSHDNNNDTYGRFVEYHNDDNSQPVATTSLLVTHFGISARTTHDMYTSCCAGAFYSSAAAMGLSAVINAWLAATPLSGTRYFVRYHSLAICSIPGLLAVSTGLAGVGLFIGLDRSEGTPISYIGLFGTLLGGVMIGSTTVRGMICTYRLLTPLVRKL